ncbi:MAG: glycosyl hydrolase family 28 protein [Terracidiphilus sp.]
MLRRDFLRLASMTLTLGSPGTKLVGQGQTSNIKNVLDYGVKPDGRTLNTRAIQRVIDDVFQGGGGTVYFPAGTFLTGRIDLKSGVGLKLDTGCTLLGSTSINDYHGGDGSADASQKHLIYARDCEGVTIEGEGRIDGQGPSFWEPSGKAPLPPDEQWADVASHAYKEKKSGRPSPMVRFANCRRVRVSGVQLENSAGWTLHLLNCDDVQIVDMTIKNPVYGPNTDGIDITGCQNVQVSRCSIETGDDAICLKSENPLGPEPRLVRNVTVTNCSLSTCCNGFKLGTSSEGGFENIVFSNSVIHNTAVPLGQRVISGVALEVIDGGWIDGVHVSGIQMQRARTPIFIRLGNRKRVHDYSRHGLRHVVIENIQASESVLASSITGLSGDEVHDITLRNVHIESVMTSRPEWARLEVPEKESAYPEARMFGMLPTWGLYARHVRDLQLDLLAFTARAPEQRPTVLFDDVDGAQIAGLASTAISGAMPIVSLANSRNISITDSVAPAGTEEFVGVSGRDSNKIVLANDDLRGARESYQAGSDVPPHAVTVTGAPRSD